MKSGGTQHHVLSFNPSEEMKIINSRPILIIYFFAGQGMKLDFFKFMHYLRVARQLWIRFLLRGTNNNFISSLWHQDISPLSSTTQQAMPQNNRRKVGNSVLTPGSLCLPCCMRNTAWSWFNFNVFLIILYIITWLSISRLLGVCTMDCMRQQAPRWRRR